jgi:hypothetical protein
MIWGYEQPYGKLANDDHDDDEEEGDLSCLPYIRIIKKVSLILSLAT